MGNVDGDNSPESELSLASKKQRFFKDDKTGTWFDKLFDWISRRFKFNNLLKLAGIGPERLLLAR